jgi:hypothetical protein
MPQKYLRMIQRWTCDKSFPEGYFFSWQRFEMNRCHVLYNQKALPVRQRLFT